MSDSKLFSHMLLDSAGPAPDYLVSRLKQMTLMELASRKYVAVTDWNVIEGVDMDGNHFTTLSISGEPYGQQG